MLKVVLNQQVAALPSSCKRRAIKLFTDVELNSTNLEWL